MLSHECCVNLLKLADYLDNMPISAPVFAMSEYSGRNDGATCGSSGCAVGHATICVEPRRIAKFGSLVSLAPEYETWERYQKRVFPGLDQEERLWLFSGEWSRVDNTPEGAAKRIRWLIDKGLPVDWEAQIDGEVDLCYDG